MRSLTNAMAESNFARAASYWFASRSLRPSESAEVQRTPGTNISEHPFFQRETAASGGKRSTKWEHTGKLPLPVRLSPAVPPPPVLQRLRGSLVKGSLGTLQVGRDMNRARVDLHSASRAPTPSCAGHRQECSWSSAELTCAVLRSTTAFSGSLYPSTSSCSAFQSVPSLSAIAGARDGSALCFVRRSRHRVPLRSQTRRDELSPRPQPSAFGDGKLPREENEGESQAMLLVASLGGSELAAATGAPPTSSALTLSILTRGNSASVPCARHKGSRTASAASGVLALWERASRPARITDCKSDPARDEPTHGYAAGLTASTSLLAPSN